MCTVYTLLSPRMVCSVFTKLKLVKKLSKNTSLFVMVLQRIETILVPRSDKLTRACRSSWILKTELWTLGTVWSRGWCKRSCPDRRSCNLTYLACFECTAGVCQLLCPCWWWVGWRDIALWTSQKEFLWNKSAALNVEVVVEVDKSSWHFERPHLHGISHCLKAWLTGPVIFQRRKFKKLSPAQTDLHAHLQNAFADLPRWKCCRSPRFWLHICRLLYIFKNLTTHLEIVLYINKSGYAHTDWDTATQLSTRICNNNSPIITPLNSH